MTNNSTLNCRDRKDILGAWVVCHPSVCGGLEERGGEGGVERREEERREVERREVERWRGDIIILNRDENNVGDKR